MKKQLLLILILAVIGFAACNDKEDLSNEKWIVESINDDSTYTMEDCVGTLTYEADYGCYVFHPDFLYGDPFQRGEELCNELLLNNIPDSLKAYEDSTLVISGTYNPVCVKTEKGTNCPLIIQVYNAEITKAAPYKIVYEEDFEDTVSGGKKVEMKFLNRNKNQPPKNNIVN